MIADEGTTNALTGEPTGAFTMSGAAEAGVITPFSAFQADLDGEKVAKLAEAMGLPEGFDFVNENPFGSETGLTEAEQLAFEKAASELMTALQVAASAAQAAAGGEDAIDDLDAFDQAFKALVEKVQEELDESAPDIDFSSRDFVKSVVDGTTANVAEKTGEVVTVDSDGVTDQILHLTETIRELESLDDDDAVKEILGGVQKSVAELAALDDESDPVNLSPSKLELLGDGDVALGPVRDDVEAGDVIAQVAVTDDDGHNVFKFEITGGADADKLEIDETTGEISFKDDPDATAQDSYEVTIKVTEYDADGTTLLEDNFRTKTFTIELENVDEGPAVVEYTVNAPVGEVHAAYEVSVDVTSVTDPDGVASVAYVWKLGGVVVDGAASNAFTPGDGDIDETLTLEIVVTDETGAETVEVVEFGRVQEPPNEAPQIALAGDAVTDSGVAVDDDAAAGSVIATVSVSDADAHDDGFLSVALTNNAGGKVVLDEDGSLKFADDYAPDATVDASLEVELTATDRFGAQTVETVTININNVDEGPATGDLGASGDAISIGDTATLDPVLDDPDGIVATEIVWKLDGEVIEGATGTEYTLADADAGKTLTAEVTVTDGAGVETTLSHDFGTVAGDVVLNVTPREAVDLMAQFHGAESWEYGGDENSITVTAGGVMLSLQGTIPNSVRDALGDPSEEFFMFEGLYEASRDAPDFLDGLDLQSASVFAPVDGETPAARFDFASAPEGVAWLSKVISGEAIHMPALIEMHVSPAELEAALFDPANDLQVLATGLAAFAESVGGEMEALFGALETAAQIYVGFDGSVLTVASELTEGVITGYRYEVALSGSAELTEEQVLSFLDFMNTGFSDVADWLDFGAIEEIRFIGPEDPLFTLQLDGTGGATVLIVDDGAGEGAVKTIGIDGAFNNSVQGLADFLSALSSASMVDIAYPEEPNPADFGSGHWQEYAETYSELVFGDPEQQDAYWAAYNAWVEEGGTEPDPSTYGGAYEDVEYTYEEYVFDDPDDQQAYNDALDAYDAEVEQLEQDAWAASTVAVIEILKGNANSYDIDGFWAKLTGAEAPLLSVDWDTAVNGVDAIEIMLGNIQIDLLGTFPDDIGGWAEFMSDFYFGSDFDGLVANPELFEIESMTVQSHGEDGSTDLFTVSFGSTLGALVFLEGLMIGEGLNLGQAMVGTDGEGDVLLYDADGRFMLVSDSVDLEGLYDYGFDLPEIVLDFDQLAMLPFMDYFL